MDLSTADKMMIQVPMMIRKHTLIYRKKCLNLILKELNKLAEGKFEITANDVEFKETEDEIIE